MGFLNVSYSVTRLGNIWTFCNFLKPLATINLPQSSPFLGNFCKGVKIIHLLGKLFLGNFYRHLAIFIWSHWTVLPWHCFWWCGRDWRGDPWARPLRRSSSRRPRCRLETHKCSSWKEEPKKNVSIIRHCLIIALPSFKSITLNSTTF